MFSYYLKERLKATAKNRSQRGLKTNAILM